MRIYAIPSNKRLTVGDTARQLGRIAHDTACSRGLLSAVGYQPATEDKGSRAAVP